MSLIPDYGPHDYLVEVDENPIVRINESKKPIKPKFKRSHHKPIKPKFKRGNYKND